MTRTTIVVVALVGLTTIGGTVPAFYVIRAGAPQGQLVWNETEAYMLISVQQTGWTHSPLGALVAWFMGLAKFGVPADHGTRSNVLLRLTNSKTDVHVVDHVKPTSGMFLIDSGVGAGTVRWNGSRLEPVSPDLVWQVRMFPTADFTGWNGWSGLRFGAHASGWPPHRIPFAIAGEPVTLIVSGDLMAEVISVALQRGNAAPESLWSVDRRLRWVGSTEYFDTFSVGPGGF